MAKKKYWAGFCDGKIAIIQNLLGMDEINVVEIYTNRKHAKIFFQDVRQVEIREVKISG